MKHKLNCEKHAITTIKTSPEPHIYWKKHFHRNPLYFRLYADFEVDNEFDNSSIGNKTTNLYEPNPMLNGYRVESELNDVLQSRYYEYPLGYDNVDWFDNEVTKLENKMIFYFKKTKKDITMTENDKDFKKKNICRFCEKK